MGQDISGFSEAIDKLKVTLKLNLYEAKSS